VRPVLSGLRGLKNVGEGKPATVQNSNWSRSPTSREIRTFNLKVKNLFGVSDEKGTKERADE